ncbi:MAG TPA: leucyl aminopeptidase [Vicinamibacterales bacterium]|nr:leucyl aminopeptidase [Vicinamibacterales bacterium]
MSAHFELSETTFLASVTAPGEQESDVVFIPVFEGDDGLVDAPGLDAATGGEVGRARQSGEFRAKFCHHFITPVQSGWRARRVALIGAGRHGDFDAERQRQVAATCAHLSRRVRASRVACVVRGVSDPIAGAQHAADGMSAADFLTATFKKDGDLPGPLPKTVTIVATGADQAGLAGSVRRGRIIGESANVARALANEPANVLTPREFAARASAEGGRSGLTVDVLDEYRLRELGMRLVLAVGQGSAEPPRLVVLRHDPLGASDQPLLALVGKGVTFDTGGVSIKPSEGMDRMKYDMSGGAAVIGAMRAIARLDVPRRVVGIVPMVENMVGSKATRPGDVVAGANGKTVEINNTDAEGRLILADALWYATHLGASHLVDVATLTGSCMVALGNHVSGLMGGPAAWTSEVQTAAERAGDRFWTLPIYREAREQMRSEIADLINTGGRPGGAITAAAFLREFTNGLPWAHIDIAGTAWAEKAEPSQPKGPTGVAVRALIELATSGSYPSPPRAD